MQGNAGYMSAIRILANYRFIIGKSGATELKSHCCNDCFAFRRCSS